MSNLLLDEPEVASTPADAFTRQVESPKVGQELPEQRVPKLARLVKIGFGVAMVAIAGYAVVSQRGYIASNNAVVSANVVQLRVPIDGYVSRVNFGVGSEVARGTNLGHVENPMWNEQALAELRASIQRDRLELLAIDAERDELTRERRSLEYRRREYLKASTERLEQLVAQEQRTVESKEALRDETGLQLYRTRSLAQDGIVARAALDTEERAYKVADQDAQAESHALEALQTEAEASSKGIMLDSGSTGEPYAQQRLDEIAMKLADLNRQSMQMRIEGDTKQQTLAEIEPKFNLLHAADVPAPVNGVVWKLSAANGERVSAGSSIGQIVDCQASFLVATVPQNRVSDVKVGGAASYWLSGESTKHRGTVVSVLSQRDRADDASLAASPVAEKDPTARVYVSTDGLQGPGTCLVGRTARVLVPIRQTSLLARWNGLR